MNFRSYEYVRNWQTRALDPRGASAPIVSRFAPQVGSPPGHGSHRRRVVQSQPVPIARTPQWRREPSLVCPQVESEEIPSFRMLIRSTQLLYVTRRNRSCPQSQAFQVCAQFVLGPMLSKRLNVGTAGHSQQTQGSCRGTACCLTPRSTGAPTAGRQARSVARYILHSPGLAPCRRRPVNSNVRPRRTSIHALPRVLTKLALLSEQKGLPCLKEPASVAPSAGL